MSHVKDLRIQKLTIADAALLSEVALKAYCDHYLHLWHDGGEWYINKCFTKQVLEAELSDNNAAFYITYYNDKPVGFLKLNIDASRHAIPAKDALELERIYLDSEVTAKGIGRQLVEFTFQVAREHNKKVVWLKAMDSSAEAINFYKKMGFKITGTYTLPFEVMKKELRGMVIMEKVLQ